MENFDQANQWKLNGECAKCRRRNYCHRDCTAKRKKDQETIKKIVGQAFDPIDILPKGLYGG